MLQCNMPLYDARGNPLPPTLPVLVDPVFDSRVEQGGYRLIPRTATAEFRADLEREIKRERMDAGVNPWRQANIDGFVNELSGLGTLWGDKSRGGMPGGPGFALYRMHGPEAMDRVRGSDLGANICNKIPDEMTREGVTVDVQPTEEDELIATDSRAQLDACIASPHRAAEAWRREGARRGRFDGARCYAIARQWDAWPAQPPSSSPPPLPPPGPLPKINDDGAELTRVIEEWTNEVDVIGAINLALRYERTYGGGAVFIGVDDGEEDLTQPLDWRRVRKVTHLTAFAGGWDGEIIAWRPYNDPRKPKHGLPEIYQVRNLSVQLARPPAPGETRPVPQIVPMGPTGPTIFYVHESRFLIFDGEPASRQVRQEMRGWGDSVFTRTNETLASFDQTWNGVAVLMQEFSLVTVAIEGYAEMLTSGTPAAQQAVMQRARMLQLTQSVARARLLDSREKMERMTVSLGGVAEVLREMKLRLAAAADMPASLLFGETIGGLGGDAEKGQVRYFYDRVRAAQNRRMIPRLHRLYDLMLRSSEGPTRGRVPERWSVSANPLWQSTPAETAALRLQTTQADQIEISQQVVTPEEVAATRYGGSEYNPGPIVLDLEARTMANAPPTPRTPASKPAPGPNEPPLEGPPGTPLPTTAIEQPLWPKVPPMTAMPSDPVTSDPTSQPSEIGQTGKGGKPVAPKKRGDAKRRRP